MNTASPDMIEKFKLTFARGAALQALLITKLHELEIGEIANFAVGPHEEPLAALTRIRDLTKKHAKELNINIIVKKSGGSIRIRRIPSYSTGMYSEWTNLNLGQSDSVYEGNSLAAELKKAREISDKLSKRGEGRFDTWEEGGEILVRRVAGRNGGHHGYSERWKNVELTAEQIIAIEDDTFQASLEAPNRPTSH